MKITFSLLIFSLLTFSGLAQDFSSIKVDPKKPEIAIDKFIYKKGTTIDEVTRVFGKPERIEKIGGKDRVFAYDSKGVAFSVDPTDGKKLESVSITYTFDGDRKVAKEKFKGTLQIEGLTVTEKTTSAEISEKTGIKNIACFGPMCVTNPKEKGLFLMMSLTEQKEIGQIGFGVKQ